MESTELHDGGAQPCEECRRDIDSITPEGWRLCGKCAWRYRHEQDHDRDARDGDCPFCPSTVSEVA